MLGGENSAAGTNVASGTEGSCARPGSFSGGQPLRGQPGESRREVTGPRRWPGARGKEPGETGGAGRHPWAQHLRPPYGSHWTGVERTDLLQATPAGHLGPFLRPCRPWRLPGSPVPRCLVSLALLCLGWASPPATLPERWLWGAEPPLPEKAAAPPAERRSWQARSRLVGVTHV